MNNNMPDLVNVFFIKKALRLITTLLILFLLDSKPLFAENISITFSPDRVVGTVNPLIYGNNMMGYDLTHTGKGTNFVGYSNYGAGIWDPGARKSVERVIKLAKGAGITIARFPGGSGSLFYNWKNSIGPPERRPKFLYGLDEFLKTCEEIGCEVVYTLPYVTGSSEDAADLVEYLNAPNDNSNPRGGKDWAAVRAENGHPEPYNVRYFELGNEVNFGAPAIKIPGVDPVTYAKDYREYKQKMKLIDSSIMLGAVTVNSGWSKGLSPWNDELFKVAGDSIDFLIDHTYASSYAVNSEIINPNIIFSTVLKHLEEIEISYRKLATHFEKVTGRKHIPIAVTEYNAGFDQEKPVPFRHSLGASLINAGLLQIYLNPANNILMANYWQFVNSYWGMIKNDEFMEGTGTYIERPNYYVFKMFHTYFGDELIDVNITGKNIATVTEEKNILANISWKTNYAVGADIKVQNEYLEVDFKGHKDLNFHHAYKRVAVKPNTIYKLTGFLKAEDLKDREGVCLSIGDGRGWSKTHSAETTERVWGTTDWVKVELSYTTLSDASEVSVMMRRLSGQGLIKGKVHLKNVVLVEKQEIGLEGVHALSVSASRTKDGKRMFLMVLNKNVYKDVEAEIHSVNDIFLNNIDIWTLNGSNIQAVNEVDPKNVTIKYKSIKVKDIRRFNYSFPAHSLSSIEFKVR